MKLPIANPIVAGFNPDPSICRVDDTYYLVTSTFEYQPGLPIYRSTDLVTWEQIGNVAPRDEQLRLAGLPAEGGVFAPTIRHHDGVFHVITTVAGSRWNVVFTATDPAGPWSDGIELPDVSGIDPDLAWDEDGTAYVTFAGADVSGPEPRMLGIVQCRVDLATGRALEEPRTLWQGTGLKFPEGPHVFRRGGHWYLMLAEGGTERGHAVSIARGPSPTGPFEGCPHNPLLTASGTPRPVQNTGHADLVEMPDGDWAMVCLGARTSGVGQRFTPFGRETFLTSVRWEDDWPVVDPVELGDPRLAVTERFGFAADAEWDAGWLAVRRSAGHFASQAERDGWLVLTGPAESQGGLDALDAAFVGRRQRHDRVTWGTRVDASEGRGGLAMRSDEDHHVSITTDGAGEVVALAKVRGLHQSWTARLGAGPEVELTIGVEPAGSGWGTASLSDTLVLSAGLPGEALVELARLDGRYWCMEVAAHMTGRVFGLLAEQGRVAFDGLHYDGSDSR